MNDSTLINAAAEAAKTTADGKTSEAPQEFQELSADDQLLVNFEMLLVAVGQATKEMSARQLGRLLRATLAAPFKDPPKFVDPLEAKVFNMMIKAFDLKMAIIGKMLSDSEEQEKILAQARAEAEAKAKEKEDKAAEAAGGESNG
jgi:hypothetical protein